jgi:SAM-dependent methyltransferase
MQMLWGFAPPLILETAVRNGFFDALDKGPRTAGQVAEATGASQRGTRMVLDALVGLGLLAKGDGGYALTPESSAFLVSTKPGFQGGLFRHVSRQILPNWLNLSDIVRTGKPSGTVNREEQGAEFFRQFVEDLLPMGYAAAQALADHLGVAGRTGPVGVLDLAAGSGVWSIALAQRSPAVRVTAVDWAEVIPVTKRVTQRHGVADRYRFVEGDLLAADFGSGHAVATLGHIIHSEGEARSRKLLAKVFASLAPGGVVAIAEMVPNDARTGPAMPLIFALNMLAHTDEGDTFTFAEMGGWLREAGFADVRQLEAPGPSPLILATKPG